jgi:hypothetical protein
MRAGALSGSRGVSEETPHASAFAAGFFLSPMAGRPYSRRQLLVTATSVRRAGNSCRSTQSRFARGTPVIMIIVSSSASAGCFFRYFSAASFVPKTFLNRDYTERKKDRAKNISIPRKRRLRRTATGRRAKQGLASSWRPFPRSTEAPPGCFFSGR